MLITKKTLFEQHNVPKLWTKFMSMASVHDMGIYLILEMKSSVFLML